MFQTKVSVKVKTHFFMFNKYFFLENLVVYEIMLKNTVESDSPQMTMWRMRVACWIPKAIDTPSEYVILMAFNLQQWLHEFVSLSSFTYIASPVDCGASLSEQLLAGGC